MSNATTSFAHAPFASCHRLTVRTAFGHHQSTGTLTLQYHFFPNPTLSHVPPSPVPLWAPEDAATTPTPVVATLSPDAAPGDTLAPVAGGDGNEVDAEGADGALATAALPSGAVYTGLFAVMVAVAGGVLL